MKNIFNRFTVAILICSIIVSFSACANGKNTISEKQKKLFDKILSVGSTDNLSSEALPGFKSPWVPEGVSYDSEKLGGKELPQIGTNSKSNTPIISNFSDICYPDETLAVTGEGLENAELFIWAEGSTTLVKPLRSDNSKLQAVIPDSLSKSMMIVWPRNENGFGSPIRVNAPEIWWCDKTDLYENSKESTIRFFGSCLSINGKKPIVLAVYENGKQEVLEIVNANSYRITAKYPKNLKNGVRCKFYVHNGTGGDYGWSDRVVFNTLNSTVESENKSKTYKIDDYGAKANDGKSDDEAIKKAINAAKEQGGGVISFGKGEYHIKETINIEGDFPKGLYITGVGKGKYALKSDLTNKNCKISGLSGQYTMISFLSLSSIPKQMINIISDNVTLENMTVHGADIAMNYQKTDIFVSGNNITLNNIRSIKSDARYLTKQSDNNYRCTGNLAIGNNSENITVANCDFHGRESMISAGSVDYSSNNRYNDDNLSRNIVITKCDFYGYTYPYNNGTGIIQNRGEAQGSCGIHGTNLDGAVIENCTFQGYDRDNCKLLIRSIYMSMSAQKVYIANNLIKNAGNNPKSGFDNNTGEQILFHCSSTSAAIFNVVNSTENTLTVRTDNIKLRDDIGKLIESDDTVTNAGSRLNAGINKGTQGFVYISGGRGAGQVRRVVGYKKTNNTIEFTLDEKFAVEPDNTSVVNLTPTFNHNIVYNNKIYNDKLLSSVKTGGVLFFHQSYKNIVANNKIQNLSFGIVLNSGFKMPTMWNTIRDNSLSQIRETAKDAAQGGDTTYNATFLCESVQGNAGVENGFDSYNIWYTVGNVFRNNNCSNGDTAAEITTNRWYRLAKGWNSYYGTEKGNTLTVFENNTFKNVAQGVLIGNPAHWTLIRNNNFTFASKEGYISKAIINEQSLTNFKLLYIVNGKIVADANNTVKEK